MSRQVTSRWQKMRYFRSAEGNRGYDLPRNVTTLRLDCITSLLCVCDYMYPHVWDICGRWHSSRGLARRDFLVLKRSERSRSADYQRAFSSAAHQARPCTVADFPYRTTCHDLSVNGREVILVVTAQSTRIRYVNLVRRPTALDDPDTAGFANSQDRH